MTIALFLIFAALAMGGLFFFRLRKQADFWPIYLMWGLLAASAITTINAYVYPSDQTKIFGNADYHVIEHLGFAYSDSLQLVNDAAPSKALWDDKKGRVMLRGAEVNQFSLNGFAEPFFTHDADVKRDAYALQNAPLSFPIEEKLVFNIDEKHFLTLRMEDGERDTVKYFVRFKAEEKERQCRFYSKLKVGYPVVDIIRTARNGGQYVGFLDMLEGSYLLRPEHGRNAELKPLVFFPGPAFPLTDSIVIGNGATFEKANKILRKFEISIPDEQNFQIGIGMQKMPIQKIRTDSAGKRLVYDFPRKDYLRNELQNNLFICSANEDVVENSSEAGYFYPLLTDEENQFHVNGRLLYEAGTARQELMLRYINPLSGAEKGAAITDTILAGEQFRISTHDKTSQLAWIFRLTDLRAESPIQAYHLYGFVLFFILLVFISAWLIGERKISMPEMIAYVAIFAFLVVRVVLQWRISTFLPVEEVTQREFASLASGKHFFWTAAFTLLFFVARWMMIPFQADDHDGSALVRIADGIKEKISKNSLDLRSYLQQKWPSAYGVLSELDHPVAFVFQYFVLLILAVLGFKILGILPFFDPERFINIGAPVGIFLWMEVALVRAKQNAFSNTSDSVFPFAHLLNFLITTAVLAVTDSGFAIIFVLFLLLYYLVQKLMRLNLKRHRKAIPILKEIAPILGLAIAFVIIILKGDALIVLVLQAPVTFYYALLIPVVSGIAASFAWFAWQHSNKFANQVKQKQILLIVGPMLAVSLLMFLGGGFVKSHKNYFNYVKYRAAIQSTPIGEIITGESFESPEVKRVLQAGQNQWFINAYLHAPLSPDGRHDGYFKLKPHFKKGASFHAQTTDIVVTRFLISEHSTFVVLMLLVILLLATSGFALNRSDDGDSFKENYAFPLLLSTSAFFIWLTATNRFVFFGQDFPLLSLTSKFTLVFTFFIFLLAISFAKKTGVVSRKQKLSLGFKVVLPFALLTLLGIFLPSKNADKTADSADSFSISLKDVKTDFSRLNEKLVAFQSEYHDEFRDTLAIDTLVKRFYYDYLQDTIQSKNKFSQSLFVNLIKGKGDRTDPRRIVHLVKNEQLYYEFAINHQYYLVPPPQHHQFAWEGHLLAAKVEAGVKLIDMDHRDRFVIIRQSKLNPNFSSEVKGINQSTQMVTIPDTWMKSGRPAILLWDYDQKPNAVNFQISNNELTTIDYAQGFNNPVVRLMPNDFVTFFSATSRKQSKYKYVESHDYYLAKNIWLNGKRRAFYPLGERLFWAYNYSNLIKSAYSSRENKQRNVQVSLDYQLSEKVDKVIEAAFKKMNWDDAQRFAVTGINGKGQIRLIADYHAGKRANPNEIDDLNEYRMRIQKERSTKTERELMGNLNFTNMRAGPGSTMKPIVYAAVTSQYDIGWPSLSYLGGNKSALYKGKKMKMYGGKDVNLEWRLDNGEFAPANSMRYLSGSINMYHALVMFIGSYDREAIRNGYPAKDPRNAIFRPYNATDPVASFPGFNLGGQTLSFNLDNWPRDNNGKDRFFGNPKSLMGDGLLVNFKLETTRPRDSELGLYTVLDPKKNEDVFRNGAGSSAKYWSYPARSSFYQERRARSIFIGLQQSVIHGGAVVEMTPVKMAEMMMKLYTQNASVAMSLDDDLAEPRKEQFNVDKASWGSSVNYERFLREVVFEGMHSVPILGTARALSPILKKKLLTHPELSAFHYYGKTGTTSSGEKDANDKLFALIISKEDVRKVENLAGNKIYVLYFTGSHLGSIAGSQYYDLVADVVLETLNSYLFKQYMGIQ